MEDQKLIDIIQKYGTPTFVFDTDALKKRVQAIQKIWGNEVSLCYSVKANPFLIPSMLEVVNHLEVCSPGELEICENLHIPMKSVVYSGINKEPSDIHQAVSDGVEICTAESLRHISLLEKEGKGSGKVIPVLLRLNAGSQFGMSQEDLLYVIRNRKMWPHLSFEGVHYFVGTQRKNRELHQQKDELEMLRVLFSNIQQHEGFRLKRLEYGPGLPVPLFEKDDFSDTLAPAKEIADALKSVTEWVDLTVEAGRFFTTECGYYLTKVVDMKEIPLHSGGKAFCGKMTFKEQDSLKDNKVKRYCIVDGGINHVNYLGQIMGMKQPVIQQFQGNGDPDEDSENVSYAAVNRNEMVSGKYYEYAICGSLCTTNDDLVRDCWMPEIHLGDVLVFGNIGAYSITEGIYLFLSRKMPRVVLYNGDFDIHMVRDYVSTSPLNTVKSDFSE